MTGHIPYFFVPILITIFTSKILPNLKTKRIVISGGPATGKTAIIDYLVSLGYPCYEEVIRKLTKAAQLEGDITESHSNPIALVSDSYKFNSTLIDLRVDDYLAANEMNDSFCFYDRGLPDVLAYMSYFNQDINKEFIDACSTHTYDFMFLLPPWKAIFIDDEERFESFEEANDIYRYLKEAYEDFGHDVIEVPFGSVKDRANYILNCIQ